MSPEQSHARRACAAPAEEPRHERARPARDRRGAPRYDGAPPQLQPADSTPVSETVISYADAATAARATAGEPIGGSTVFSGPSTQSARFRALTPVGADPGPFSEVSPRETFRIRLAQTGGKRRETGAKRSESRDPALPGAELDPFLFSFLAHHEGKLAGSMSVRLDSPRGLAADELYRTELDALRGGQQRLVELVQVSVDMNSVPRRVLAGLFHTAYLFAGTVHGADYCLLVAAARHADFFYASLGFDYVGDERLNRRAGLPMALLAAHLPTVLEALARLGGRPVATGDPTLFANGFSPEEASGVVQRLKSLGKE
jgi:hypothetical protein